MHLASLRLDLVVVCVAWNRGSLVLDNEGWHLGHGEPTSVVGCLHWRVMRIFRNVGGCREGDLNGRLMAAMTIGSWRRRSRSHHTGKERCEDAVGWHRGTAVVLGRWRGGHGRGLSCFRRLLLRGKAKHDFVLYFQK